VADRQDDVHVDPAALRAGYEQLRERVLAGRADGWRLGHAVLAQGGMAGWIAAHSTSGATRPPVELSVCSAPLPIPLAQPAAPAPAPAADERIVAVLCEMALAHAA
jgi:hypothetical protein